MIDTEREHEREKEKEKERKRGERSWLKGVFGINIHRIGHELGR
jgi:hypothetical protein